MPWFLLLNFSKVVNLYQIVKRWALEQETPDSGSNLDLGPTISLFRLLS